MHAAMQQRVAQCEGACSTAHLGKQKKARLGLIVQYLRGGDPKPILGCPLLTHADAITHLFSLQSMYKACRIGYTMLQNRQSSVSDSHVQTHLIVPIHLWTRPRAVHRET